MNSRVISVLIHVIFLRMFLRKAAIEANALHQVNSLQGLSLRRLAAEILRLVELQTPFATTDVVRSLRITSRFNSIDCVKVVIRRSDPAIPFPRLTPSKPMYVV